MLRYLFLSFLSLQSFQIAFSQNNTEIPSKFTFRPLKGKIFVTYGYNRSFYSKSNLHLSGQGYDITLHKISASDEPTQLTGGEFTRTYLNPVYFSIPQFNFHIGYYFKNNWSIALGWDHMKYVMNSGQTANIDGHIDPTIANGEIQTGKYAGDYNNKSTVIAPDFLLFRHTNGFNYASIELEHNRLLWKNKKGTLGLRGLFGFGAGALVNRTIVTFFDVKQDNLWHTSGAGVSGKAGLMFDFARNFFLQADFKTGYTYLPSIRTTGRQGDIAKQSIGFAQFTAVIGIRFGGGKK